jgi:uncharacterized membrane protein YqjE
MIKINSGVIARASWMTLVLSLALTFVVFVAVMFTRIILIAVEQGYGLAMASVTGTVICIFFISLVIVLQQNRHTDEEPDEEEEVG